MLRQNQAYSDPVPWDLDDKYRAYEFVKNHGWNVPKFYKAGSLNEAFEFAKLLGTRFVIKQPGYHLSVGVWVLEEVDQDHYIDLLNFRVLKREDIQPVGAAPEYYLVEEFVESAYGSDKVPLDYKLYAFGGNISHILQIDRNVWPFRVAMFDNAFMPIKPGMHLKTNISRYRHGGHIIPLSAPQMLNMSQSLSKSMGCKFVRIDCYDSNRGALFGEFTFTPGAEDVGSIAYSSQILNALNLAVEGHAPDAFSGLDIDLLNFNHACATRQEAIAIIPQKIGAMLEDGAAQWDRRYAKSLVGFLDKTRIGQHFALSARLISFNSGYHEYAHVIGLAIKNQDGFIVGDSCLDQFALAAKQYDNAL
jgi:hypothetical protein